MRVAIISYQFAESTNGGLSTLVWELAHQLKANGHDVLIITGSDDRDGIDVIDGIQILRRMVRLNAQFLTANAPELAMFHYCLSTAFSLYVRSLAYLEAWKPDVIDSPESYGLGFFFLLSRQFPTIVRAVGPTFLVLEDQYLEKFSKADLKLANAFELMAIGAATTRTAISKDVARRISEFGGIPVEQFSIIPVPLATFEVLPQELSANSQSAGKLPLIVYWGRVERQKGLDILIESLPHLLKSVHSFELVIVGKPQEVGVNRNYSDVLKERLAELGLNKMVRFAGFLTTPELRELASSATLCVFPSRFETACYSAIEGMMLGKPVVATKAGALPEYVIDGVTGLLAETEDPKDLARAMSELLLDPERAMQMGKKAREHAIQLCSPSVVASQTEEVYREAIRSFQDVASSQNYSIATVAEMLDEVLFFNYTAISEYEKMFKQGEKIGEDMTASEKVSTLYQNVRRLMLKVLGLRRA